MAQLSRCLVAFLNYRLMDWNAKAVFGRKSVASFTLLTGKIRAFCKKMVGTPNPSIYGMNCPHSAKLQTYILEYEWTFWTKSPTCTNAVMSSTNSISSIGLETLAGNVNQTPLIPLDIPGLDDDALHLCRILIHSAGEQSKEIKQTLNEAGFKKVSCTNESSVISEIVEQQLADLILIGSDELVSESFQAIFEKSIPDDASEADRPCILALCSTSDQQSRQRAAEFGVADFVTLPIDKLEIVTRVHNTLRSRVATKRWAQYSTQLQTDILVDPLTRIANRRAFDFELERKMIEWQRTRSPVALIMVDIDFFKRINDQFGHQAGDAVLARVASTIEATMREMDLVCRFGGEEFAIILPINRPGESTQTAERIRNSIEQQQFRFEDVELNLTVSIGVAEAMKGDDQELIVKRADTALFDSKQRGRNRVTFHDGARCVPSKSASGDEAHDHWIRSNSLVHWSVNDDAFNVSSSTILIVDDSVSITKVVRNYLDKGGFRDLICETDSTKVLERIASDSPDLIILDIRMPDIDGLSILRSLRSESRGHHIPVIILSSHTDNETKNTALQLGANDFLHKPVIASELLVRVTNTLLANAHSQFLAGYASKLEHEIKLRTSELIASRREAIQCLARAAEIRDDVSGRHIIRVGRYAAIIAEELGFTESQVIEMEHAAQLHDVGKIGVPDAILNKKDSLTDEEFELVKAHCNQGGKIIRDEGDASHDERESQDIFLLESCSSSVMRMAALVAESHHEKWDGTGYPHGLKGENIPIEGRITAVCDVFDALSNPKTYRGAFVLQKCFQLLSDGRGTQFDPTVIDAFFRRKHEIIQVYRDFSS